MTSKLVIFLSGTVLALAACGKHETANETAANDVNMAAADNGAMNAEANAVAPSPLTAQGFANAAAASDNFEISSSKLAATQASSAAVKKFATQMITAHTASTAKLKTTLAGMSPAMTADDTLNADQQAALDALKSKTGADFDSAYAAAQVDAHQKTLDALNAYAAGGDNDALKTFAKGLVPTVTAHLNLAKGLKK
jgi:putative membrane protein